MPAIQQPRPAEIAPLALLYHENTKINAATTSQLAESVGEFAANPAEVRRSVTAAKTYPTNERISLAEYARPRAGRKPLADVLAQRHSVRQFSDRPVPLALVGALLEQAGGVTGSLESPQDPGVTQQLRAAPSGGALYPVESYLVAIDVAGLAAGVYHYQPLQQCLETVRTGALASRLESLILTVTPQWTATAVVVLTVCWETPLRKYGARGYRTLLLDVGHLAQNILLSAVALDLAACPIAGFHDDALGRELGLDPAVEPVMYVILLGYSQE